MKVIDVLKLCSCRVDIYHKGQFVIKYNRGDNLDEIDEWLLNSEVRDLDSSTDHIGDVLEVDSI